MKVGVVVPAGLGAGVPRLDGQPMPGGATVEVAQQAERLGFESVWMYDHFHTWPEPQDERRASSRSRR